jgi:hypothetical protein
VNAKGSHRVTNCTVLPSTVVTGREEVVNPLGCFFQKGAGAAEKDAEACPPLFLRE